MDTERIKITSQEQLDELLRERKDKYDAPLECFVLLNFGLRSSKDIYLEDDGDYYIYDECDDSEETLRHSELMKSFIGEAISKGALYKY